MNDIPSGIRNDGNDITGRESPGVVLAVGRKGPNGAPIEKDRFHLMSPIARETSFTSRNGSYGGLIRDGHPSFAGFNGINDEKDIGKRQIMRGQIAHLRISDCFDYRYNAQTLKGHEVPHKAPSCMGNGEIAKRWMRDRNDYADIACPAERCAFRKDSDDPKNPTPCKPFARLLFRLRWPVDKDGRKLPEVLAIYTTRSWNTISSIKGFFDSFRAQAASVGVPDPSPFGLMFMLHLGEKTFPKRKARAPVVTMAPDGVDTLALLGQQQAMFAQIRENYRPPLALTDAAMDSVVTAPFLDTDGPAIPGKGG